MRSCKHKLLRELNDGRCLLCDPEQPIPITRAQKLKPRVRTQLEREIIVRSFADFVERYWPVVTGMPYVANKATTGMIDALQRVADGKCTRLCISIAPGTGKSTTLALYSAWRFARNPSHRAIHAMHAFDLAATESRRVRRLVESEEFQALFPIKLRDDESTVAHWANESDGRYFAVGTDGAVTGRRCHEAIVDDPANVTDRFSKTARDAVYSWYTESLSTRLDGDNAPMVIVAQRIDRDDLIGRLLAAGGYEHLVLPAEDENGELLAPNVLSREKLDVLKQQIGASTYACQYLQRPADDSNAIIKRVWWRFHRPASVPITTPRPLGCETEIPAVDTPVKWDRVVLAVDMTFGTTHAKADFAVIQVWGKVGGARYLIEQWRKRATQLEQREAIKMLAKKYAGAKIVVEVAAGGKGALEILNADGIHAVGVLTGGKSKAERIGMVSPTIESGSCYLPLGAAWLPEFVEELAGAGSHDDSLDACAYGIADLNTDGFDVAAKLEAVATKKAAWLALAQKHGIELPYVFTHGKRI